MYLKCIKIDRNLQNYELLCIFITKTISTCKFFNYKLKLINKKCLTRMSKNTTPITGEYIGVTTYLIFTFIIVAYQLIQPTFSSKIQI